MWTRREKPRLESVLPAVRINEGHHLRYVEGKCGTYDMCI